MRLKIGRPETLAPTLIGAMRRSAARPRGRTPIASTAQRHPISLHNRLAPGYVCQNN